MLPAFTKHGETNMLGRLVLLLLQVIVAWGAGPIIRGYVPVGGMFDLFVYAAIFAVLVYLTGILVSLIVKGVGTPSPATLTAALVVALIVAAFATWGMDLVPQIPSSTISKRGLVLLGALLGYFVKR
jgi:hypothetical protein